MPTTHPIFKKHNTLVREYPSLSRYISAILPSQIHTRIAKNDPATPRTKREQEFRKGRKNAQALLQQLGCQETVGRAEDRTPVWPAGFAGSISHSDRWTWVAIGRKTHLNSIGIDTEPLVNTETRNLLEPEIATVTEWKIAQATRLLPNQIFTLVFSAKEAFFKCWYPLTKQYLDFNQITIEDANPKYLWASTNCEATPDLPIQRLKVLFHFSATDAFTATWINR